MIRANFKFDSIKSTHTFVINVVFFFDSVNNNTAVLSFAKGYLPCGVFCFYVYMLPFG